MSSLLVRGICFSLFLGLMNVSAQASLESPSRGARFATQEFQRIRSQPDPILGNSSREILRKRVRVLLVPGFLGDAISQLKSLSVNGTARLGEYFDEQQEWLRLEGIDVLRVELGPDQSPLVNAREIVRQIEASPKEVVLIAHSKGGVDSLQALAKRPDLWPKVKAFVAIQTPFWGTPVVEHVQGLQVERYLAREIIHWLGGCEASFKSLSVWRREAWMKAHEAANERLRKKVPILSVSTVKHPEPGQVDSILFYPRNQMEKHGIFSDGLVPWRSQIFPGSELVLLEGVDHAVTVMPGIFREFDRKRFLETLLEMVVRRVPQ